jgi:AraC family transcriptional regulator of adaptative response/methylated-DNA-[protein]-cysteine methyltransferase
MSAAVSMAEHGNSDYARVARIIRFIQSRVHEQPSLAECAAHVGLSEFHVQRLFQRWAGVSPKRFLQFLTLDAAKLELAEARSLLDASLAVGLSGPSRLHDLFLAIERMTPGEYKAQAAGLTLRWGVEATPLGPALLAALDRGLCGVSFLGDGGEAAAVEELAARWPRATLARAPGAVARYGAALRARLRGEPAQPFGVVLKGTPFQLQVWEALLRVPPGALVSYGDVAERVCSRAAARAVGAAVGANPLAVLIPCHRVIRGTSAFGGYRWGAERKLALLAAEHARE